MRFLTALLLSAAAFAQTSGTLAGRIVAAADGTPLPKAAIQAKNTATGATFSARSASNGSFTLGGLPAGSYEITGEFPPLFIPTQLKADVRAGQTSKIDLRLEDFNLGTIGDGGATFVSVTSEQPAPKGLAPRTREGKPDLTGLWLAALPIDLGHPEPLPWAEALVKERGENFGKDVPSSKCLPMGVAMQGYFFPVKFVQTPTLLVIVDEFDPVRQVFLEGRRHPAEINPSYMGHSVGRWEGTTLVVDTVGFNDRTWLSLTGLPHTEMLRVTERFRRPDLGHLETEIMIDDPGTYRQPWKMKRITSLAPKNIEIMETICAENERDRGHLVGK